MEKGSRVNIFTKNQVANNFFIELPVETDLNQKLTNNWVENLLDLSKNEEMMVACNEKSSKDFLSILFKNNVLTLADKGHNSPKIIVGEANVYTNIEGVVEGYVLTDGVAIAEAGVVVVVLALAVGDMLNDFELRNDKYKAITRFANKNGGVKFGNEIASIFKQLESGESVLL